MEDNSTETDRRRVLLVSFCAQGHINPALQFAKRLTRHRVHVTFVTSLSVCRRMSKVPTFPHISFAFFSDGYDDGLKPGDQTPRFMSELERLGSKAVTDMITKSADEGQPFTCVVYSLILPWVATAARSLHLPAILLWIQPATVFALYYYYYHGYKHAIQHIFDDPLATIQLPGLPPLTSLDVPTFFNSSDVYQFALPIFQRLFELLDQESSPTVVVNSVEELERDAVRAMEGYHLLPIGPLVPSAFLDGEDPRDAAFGGDMFGSNNGNSGGDYIQWLNSKPRGSVVYVSFGSVVTLSNQQIEEIGRGLLSFGRPFLWVIRDLNPHAAGEHTFLSCREEVEAEGKIVSWSSQLEVLSSPATGCFVTHGGWNSTLESLACGVPVVVFPQWSDQGTNAKIVRDLSGTGVRVEVGADGLVTREEIRRCLEMVMKDSKEGEQMRNNALKWKMLTKEAASQAGSSHSNFNAFVDQISLLNG